MRLRAASFFYLLCGCQLLLIAGYALGYQPPAVPSQSSKKLAAEARAALSVTRGRLKLPGLQLPVKVLRDYWGVPHIYAENQHDLFFAQGFVAAQDRMFQMEIWKRSGQGRLAEVLGPAEVETDHFARLLRYRGDMDAEYASYAPDARQILEAFTAGINAFIAEASRPGSRGLPLEFRLAGFRPEPWKPEDCLSRMAAFSMTGNASSELRDAQILSKYGAEAASQLLRFDPDVRLDPAPGLDLSGLSPDLLKGLAGSDRRIEFPVFPPNNQSSAAQGNVLKEAAEPEDSAAASAINALSNLQRGNGSNNWTVAGKLTASGHPLLANDPHRTIGLPSLRYIVHLVAPGWNVIGGGEPALPGVSIGHNAHIAWGLTIFPVDQQDLYVEELNPADATQYKVGGGWVAMKTEETEIAVRGAAPVHRRLKFTRHGPVLWEDLGLHRALALRWAGAEPGTAGYLASLSLDRAGNWEEFRVAMRRWKLPPENMVYADTAGNIGEQSAGLTPLRRGWSGLLPAPGNRQYEWSGFIPFDDLPRVFNPQAGFYATANNNVIPRDDPYQVGYEWSQWRIDRINQVLSGYGGQKKITLADMAALQNDVVSRPALALIKLLARGSGSMAGATSAETILVKWDGALRVDSSAAALYEAWLARLRDEVFFDIAKGADGEEDLGAEAILHFFSAGENQQLMRKALAQAVEELSREQGPEAEKWRWGAMHQVEFRHDLDRQPGGAALFDRGPVARPGDGDSVDATGFDPPPRSFHQSFYRSAPRSLQRTGKKPAGVTPVTAHVWWQKSGASYREILDTGDWDRSLAVNVPGQSGQPGSRHFDDLLPLWSQGKYFPLQFSQEKVMVSAEDELILAP